MNRAYHACRLSIAKMVADTGSGLGYLWTLTFKTYTEEKEAKAKAILLFQWMRDHARQAVFSTEWHPGGHGIHFHLATCQRWDAGQMWGICARYGFGIIDVRSPMSVERLFYVAKYLAKDFTRRNVRHVAQLTRWGCIGFTGCRCKDVRLKQTLDRLVEYSLPDWRNSDYWGETPEGQLVLLRYSTNQIEERIRNAMELKPLQQKDVLARVTRGEPVIAGEYRGCEVKSAQVSDFKSGQKVARTVVEHTVEFEIGTRTVSEWLPQGADARAVKAPALKGDKVLVIVTSMSNRLGTVRLGGTILPLTQIV